MRRDEPIAGDKPKLRKVDRLAVAAAVAPTIRGQDARTKKRRVAVVDRDGNVVRYTTLDEVQKAALETAKISLAVQDGVRPREVLCARCGRVIKVPRRSRVPTECQPCKDGWCARCGGKLARNTAWRSRHLETPTGVLGLHKPEAVGWREGRSRTECRTCEVLYLQR